MTIFLIICTLILIDFTVLYGYELIRDYGIIHTLRTAILSIITIGMNIVFGSWSTPKEQASNVFGAAIYATIFSIYVLLRYFL